MMFCVLSAPAKVHVVPVAALQISGEAYFRFVGQVLVRGQEMYSASGAGKGNSEISTYEWDRGHSAATQTDAFPHRYHPSHAILRRIQQLRERIHNQWLT